jgi:phage-related protein
VPQHDKPLVWIEGEIKTPPFSAEARIEAGILLRRLQQGEHLGLPHSRPMPDIGARCHELRIRDESKTWRIFYYVAADAIVILAVHPKTTRKTPLVIIENCQRRLKLYNSIP